MSSPSFPGGGITQPSDNIIGVLWSSGLQEEEEEEDSAAVAVDRPPSVPKLPPSLTKCEGERELDGRTDGGGKNARFLSTDEGVSE